MKVAIYTRVASSNPNEKKQLTRLKEFVQAKGWQCDMYEEVSNHPTVKPTKQELLRNINFRLYEAVIVYGLDRWSRNYDDLCFELNEFAEMGITFISVNDNLDYSTASGKLHFKSIDELLSFVFSSSNEKIKNQQ